MSLYGTEKSAGIVTELAYKRAHYGMGEGG